MNPSKISVFIVDDHPLMRQALKASILTERDIEVVGTAKDGAEAIEVIPPLQPDIVIMDLMMPNVDGIEAISILAQICPNTRILALSSLEKEEAVFKAVRAGARGYLTKNTEHEELIKAIRLISSGKNYVPEKIMGMLMDGMRQNLLDEKETRPIDSLTKREKEVLSMLGRGYSNAKIAAKMVIAESTVRVHMHQIIKKMGFDNRREAVAFATRHELKK